MRFSLTTLMIFSFWAAAVMLVIMRREPWHHAYDMVSAEVNGKPIGEILRPESPDGTRKATYTELIDVFNFPLRRFSIVTTQGEVLKTFEVLGGCRSVMFADDDTVCAFRYVADWPIERTTYPLSIYKRRFPEAWWGHFYRPEVWLTFALTLVLIWRSLRRKPAPPATASILQVTSARDTLHVRS